MRVAVRPGDEADRSRLPVDATAAAAAGRAGGRLAVRVGREQIVHGPRSLRVRRAAFEVPTPTSHALGH